MEEGISAIVTAQSKPDGTLSIVLQLTDDALSFGLECAVLALTLRRINSEIVRISLTNPATGSIAYFQGALPAISLARELGFRLIR